MNIRKGILVKEEMRVTNIILFIGYILLSVLGLLLIKIGGQQQLTVSLRSISWQVSWQTMAGLICYIVSFIIYMVIIPRFNLSYISPIMSGAVFVLIILVSLVVLKEKINVYQWVGIAAVLFGIVMMNIKR